MTEVMHHYTVKELTAMLEPSGLRPSPQRLAVLSYLSHSTTHPTVDEIYRALQPDNPSLSRATVYNTLNSLVANGIVRELDIDTSNRRYDFAVSVQHAHFFCRNCGRVIDVDMKDIELPQSADFIVEQLNVNFKGLCAECAKAD